MEMYVAFLVGSPLMSEAQIWDELALHVRNNETQLHLGRRMPKFKNGTESSLFSMKI